ncbi:MAG: hypothetical protein WDZ54_06065 [Sneathiella sp.]
MQVQVDAQEKDTISILEKARAMMFKAIEHLPLGTDNVSLYVNAA